MLSVGPKTFLRKHFSSRKTKFGLRHNGWLGKRLHDPGLWHFGRRSVSGGVGLGLFLAFVPIPIQMLLAVPGAILMRVNLPATVTAVWITNPLTFAPMFIFAFKVGSWITGQESVNGNIPFEPTFNGLAATLHVIWYPLLVGCFVCGMSAGAMGNISIRWLWRLHLVSLRRRRLRRARAQKQP